MTNQQIQALLDDAVATLKLTTVGYAGRSTAWQNNQTTKWWKGLDTIGQARAALGSTPATGIRPPVDPIVSVRDAPGLGRNVTYREDIHDLVVDGTGETGVLFQQNAAGSTLKRARLLRVAAGNSVAYGKHAVYGKAADLTLEDIVAECSGYCADGLSMRYDGATVKRFSVKGAPHAITYYETSKTPGQVLFEDGDCSFTADTGVWIDVESDYTARVVQAFTFRRVKMTGSGAFLKVAATRFGGTVRLEGCILNGRPVTAADCPGVPNVTVIP